MQPFGMEKDETRSAQAGLVLEFANPRGEAARIGPFSYLCFEGETLIGGPSGQVIAKHVGHHWELTQGGSFSRLECNSRVQVHFFATKHLQSKKLGPFESFSSIDGIAYADRRVIAVCDRQLQDWYSLDVGSHWKVVVVEPA